LIVGACLLMSGFASSIYALGYWKILSFGPLNPIRTLRIVIPAATLLALGCQVVFSSFFLSILRMQRRGTV